MKKIFMIIGLVMVGHVASAHGPILDTATISPYTTKNISAAIAKATKNFERLKQHWQDPASKWISPHTRLRYKVTEVKTAVVEVYNEGKHFYFIDLDISKKRSFLPLDPSHFKKLKTGEKKRIYYVSYDVGFYDDKRRELDVVDIVLEDKTKDLTFDDL